MDHLFITELLNSPGWLQYIGDRNVHTEAQATGYLVNGPIKSYKENGYGLWAVALKESGIPIGMCGLIKRDYLENTDIGFAFLPAYAGKGYARESAEAVMGYAISTLALGVIDAIVVADNTSSISLLQKLGFQHADMIELDGEQLMLFRKQ